LAKEIEPNTGFNLFVFIFYIKSRYNRNFLFSFPHFWKASKKSKSLYALKFGFKHNNMEEAGRIVEEILNYLKEEGSVEREDIKDIFGLEEEKIEEILKFLLDLKLIEMDCQIRITKSGLEFLQL
jgi:predicted HTH transcriptional regulator